MIVVLKAKRGLGAFFRPASLIAPAAALLLAVAGCGGSDENAQREQPPSTETLASDTGARAEEQPSSSPSSGLTGQSATATETSSATEGRALPRLLDLGADKCVPCKMMAPILEELKETYEGQFDVQFIDVWRDPAPGRQYGIRVIPTQIFLDAQGNELFRHQGFMAREDILAKWAELGYEFDA